MIFASKCYLSHRLFQETQEGVDKETNEMLDDHAKEAKKFQDTLQKMDKLNEDYTKVKKISIHIQLIETIIERLPSMVLMTTILFAYADSERLGHLIGLSLKDGYYIFLVVATFACGLLGLITPLINLRFV